MAIGRGNAELQGDSLVTVRRTMRVLEMLADSDAGLSLAEISRELDITQSIALRITSSLEEMSYIHRNSETGRFYAGYKISNVGVRILGRARLLDQCQPVLRRLAEQTGELVLFSVMEEGRPRWVMAVTGARRRLQVEPMTSFEPHSTATGKAWLATLPDSEVAELLQGRMTALTAHTITDLARMMEQLREIRATSIAFSNEENESGIAAVATGIRQGADETAPCVGFVSVTAPLTRATAADFARYRDLIVEAAQGLGDAWPVPASAAFSDGVRAGDGLIVL